MDMIKKDYQAEVKAYNEKDLTIEHFISTETEDRYGDIVRAEGMKIRGKPVVLLGHGYGSMGTEPIAKPLWIKHGKHKNKKGILAKTQYFDDEQGIGRRLWGKASQGYMPNWSIGFIPLDSKERKNGGRDIQSWELLEYSQVGVPANPDAQSILSDIQNNNFNGLMQYKILSLEFEDDVKPYENEHDCHIVSKKWDKVRRENDKFGDGIDAVWGIKDDKAELSSIRFDADKYTADEAKDWCNDHDYTCNPFDAATGKEGELVETKEEEKPDIIVKFDAEDLKTILSDFIIEFKKILSDEKKKASNGDGMRKESEKVIPRLRIIDNKPEKKSLTADQIKELAEHVRNEIKTEFDRMRGKVN